MLGQLLPENARTIWPTVEDVLHGPDVTAWRHALVDNLHCADGCRVLILDATMGLRRYETMMPHQEEGVLDNRVDNTCVLTIRTREGGLLNLAVVPHDSKPCHVVAALEGTIRDVQRFGVRWLVVDNASAALSSAVHRSFPGLQGVALDTVTYPCRTRLWHRITSLLGHRFPAVS